MMATHGAWRESAARLLLPLAAAALAFALLGCAVEGQAPAPTAPENAAPEPEPEETGPRELRPDLITLPPSDLQVRHDPRTGRTVLRLTNEVANVGDGPLEVGTERQPGGDEVLATQRVYREDGSIARYEAGRFFLDRAHNHWHFDYFAAYELWTVAPDGGRGERVAERGKVAFCLRDSAPMPGFEGRAPRRYLRCDPQLQGTGVGWMDVYRSNLAGQWLDIRGLDAGRYWLVSRADPRNRIREVDDRNNVAAVLLHLDPGARSVEVLEEHSRLPE